MKHNGTEIQTMIHDNYPVKTWIHDGKIVFALCTVTFVDWDNTVLSTQTIPYGGSATKPSNPSRSGYTFTGWSGSYTNVTDDVTITATYTKNSTTPSVPATKYTVKFVDYDGTVLKEVDVYSGYSASPPDTPTRYGYTFDGWSGSYTGVTSDRTITATYSKKVYNYQMFATGYDKNPMPGSGLSSFYINPSKLTNKPTVIISATATYNNTGTPYAHVDSSSSGVAYAWGLPRAYSDENPFVILFDTKGTTFDDYTKMMIKFYYYVV